MVLKRKLPTQESKKEKIVEQDQSSDFDMSIETDVKAVKKTEKGHDLNNDFPDQVEDKPEDFIPAELRALEEGNTELSSSSFAVKEETAEEIKTQENENVLPVSFDSDDDFNTVIDEQKNNESLVKEESTDNYDDFASPFEKTDAAPAELPTSIDNAFDMDTKEELNEVKNDIKLDDTPVFDDSKDDSFNKIEENSPIEFDTPEPANWEEVVDKSEYKDESFDSFESIKWDNNTSVEATSEITDDRFKQEDPQDPFKSDNGGIIPEIPGLNDDFAKPAEVMGSNSKDLDLNGEAKKKLVSGVAVIALLVGGFFVYSNMDKTTEVANRWSGALTEANQDIAETEAEQQQMLNDGADITEAEDVISIADFTGDSSDSNVDLALLDDESTEDESSTEINLLEPEVIEKTASGKEIITATGEEEMPEDVKQGANLITNITAEIEKQKKAKDSDDLTTDESSAEKVKEEFEGNASDINKKVDDQLAEYRKLLAEEEDPGKKVKPGTFFSGNYKEGETPAKSSATVSKVTLGENGVVSTTAVNTASSFSADNAGIQGHSIIEYPQGVARKNNDGIRTLDHFRSLIVEKEDKRVRIPRNVAPGLRNQGFPKFKVISIVPNYGLIGEYNGKKGILMIGDSFKGWELIGVYESYAEFKSDTRKHIISLK